MKTTILKLNQSQFNTYYYFNWGYYFSAGILSFNRIDCYNLNGVVGI